MSIPLKKTTNIVTKYQLPLFFFLTYLLSWWSAPLSDGQLIPYGPALAAIIVLGTTSGRPSLEELWQRVTLWRTPFVWFMVGPVVILGYHAIAFLINLLLDARIMSPPHISAGIFFELLLIGGLWEEPGWSGYLLPKMMERFGNRPNGLLIAALVTGLFRGIWHLPLLLYGHIPWFDIFIFNFSFQLIAAWVFYRSGGSVMAVILLHFVSNLMGAFTAPMFTGEAHTTYTAFFMAAATVFSVGLIWKSQFMINRNNLVKAFRVEDGTPKAIL